MPLHIARDDLANMRVNAVVVPANAALRIGGGAGEAVARIAGIERMQVACDALGGCPVGGAVATPAFDFLANVVVHAVGPVWMGGLSGERDALFSCVAEALEAAARAGAETIALPLLFTGAYGFPAADALDIETLAIRRFLEHHDADVRLVLYDRASVRAGEALFDDIAEYIDDVYVGEREGDYAGTMAFRAGAWRRAPAHGRARRAPGIPPPSRIGRLRPLQRPRDPYAGSFFCVRCSHPALKEGVTLDKIACLRVPYS